MNHDKQMTVELTTATEGVILALWRKQYDTADIARLTKIPESRVYNRLLHVREAAR
jgi:hypothetical protein